MKILIDGHSLSNPQKTGKHFHTISLIRSILSHKNAKNHQFHILVTSLKNFPIKNQRLTILKARSGLGFYLDFINLQKKYDLIISPTSYIPPLLTKTPTLTFVYDLAVFHNHQFKPNIKARLIEKTLLKHIIKKSHLITMTQSIKKEITNLFLNQKMKIDIIPGFSKFSGKSTPRLKKPLSPYILFVGTFEPRKNLINTIFGYSKCVIKLKKHNQTIPKLYLVGGRGWQQKKLSGVINKLGLTKYIKIWGYVSEKKLSHLYQNALFISFIPFYEGFGLPVIEAIAYQKSVLTSNQSTLKEVLGPCGISVNPKNTNKIADSMYRLATNPHLRTTYKEATKKWIKNFSPKNSANKFYKIIEKYN